MFSGPVCAEYFDLNLPLCIKIKIAGPRADRPTIGVLLNESTKKYASLRPTSRGHGSQSSAPSSKRSRCTTLRRATSILHKITVRWASDSERNRVRPRAARAGLACGKRWEAYGKGPYRRQPRAERTLQSRDRLSSVTTKRRKAHYTSCTSADTERTREGGA